MEFNTVLEAAIYADEHNLTNLRIYRNGDKYILVLEDSNKGGLPNER